VSVRTIETRHYSCDRCDAEDAYDSDAGAGRDGWAIVNVNGRVREVTLCPNDSSRLRYFLMGQKTPAGMRFNIDEDERLKSGAS
jgi:hypothetical protein